MKIKHLILMITAAAAASSLYSCTEDPYIITAEEEYTRNFIKNFGLIDPKQDWNLAKQSAITVKVGDTPANVKAYMKVDKTYYLVANLTDVTGTLNIPFDMPEGTNDILVKINDQKYYTSPGGTVDPAAPTSRSVAVSETGEGGTATSATYAKYTTTSTIGGKPVTVVAANTSNYTYFNSLQLGPITSKTTWPAFYSVLLDDNVPNPDSKTGILPESDKPGAKKTNIENYSSRFNDSGIHDDFVFDAEDTNGKQVFTMYPMYWCTSQKLTTLGVYIVDAADNTIHRFPIYSTKRFDGDLEGYYPYTHSSFTNSNSNSGEGSGTAHVSDGPANWGTGGGGDTPVISTATEISYDLYVDVSTSPWQNNIGGGYNSHYDGSKMVVDKEDIDNYVLSKLSTVAGFKDWYTRYSLSDESFTRVPENSILDSDHRYAITSLKNSTLKNDGQRWEATAIFTLQDGASNVKSRADIDWDTWSPLSYYPVTKELVEKAKTSDRWGRPYWSSNSSVAYDWENEMLLRSRGVQITIEGYEGEFGMYIEFGNEILYSQKVLNEEYAGGILYPNDEKGKEVYGDKAGTLASSFAATYLHPISKQLYFSFEDWTGSGSDGDLNDLIFMFSGVTKIITPNKTVEIDNPDDPDDPDPIVDDPYHWLLAVEDLGTTDDFDFNDIIIGITSQRTNEKPGRTVGSAIKDNDDNSMYDKVTFTALAAGGTLPAYVFFGDELLYPDGKENRAEWHKWFGNGQYSSSTMINTGLTDNVEGAVCTIYFGCDTNGKDLFSLKTLVGNKAFDAHGSDFKIGIDTKENVQKATLSYFEEDGNYFLEPSEPGKAPQMFLIPDRWNSEGENKGNSASASKWQWPTERTHIQSCYTSFKEWVANSNATDWYKTPSSGSVCRPTPN